MKILLTVHYIHAFILQTPTYLCLKMELIEADCTGSVEHVGLSRVRWTSQRLTNTYKTDFNSFAKNSHLSVQRVHNVPLCVELAFPGCQLMKQLLTSAKGNFIQSNLIIISSCD